MNDVELPCFVALLNWAILSNVCQPSQADTDRLCIDRPLFM